jgi:type I restriction enzyme S subunit
MFNPKKLGDVLRLHRGYDITKAQQSPGPYPVVSSSGVASFHSDYKSEGPGVVIGRKGSLGTVFYLTERHWPHDTTLYVEDFKGNDPRYCYYLLKTLALERYDVGASNPTLNRNHLHELDVRVPFPVVQERIASILSAYDDLIENNTRRIAILEEMARRIFEEWFVHFRAPGCEGLPMIDSPFGPIPKGWEVKHLGQLADDIRDPADPRALDSGTAYVGLEHIPRRSTTFVEWGEAGDVSSLKLRFRCGDILFGKIRPYFHKCAVVPVEGVASSDAIVIRPRPREVRAFAASVVSSDTFVAHAVQTSNGTKMPRADWKVLRQFPVPTPQIARQYEMAVWPMIELGMAVSAQNRNLRAQRDLLLPKLISGEIDLSAAPLQLEAAE